MTLLEELAQKVSELPVEQQREVLDFAEFMRQRRVRGNARTNPTGILANPDFDLTPEDFKKLRIEMWSGFPRELES